MWFVPGFGETAVFFAGGVAAPDVALGFVKLQNAPDLFIKIGVSLPESFGDLLVNGGF